MHKINSYGKINLSLDIVSKRSDGYHNIDTIMQLIDLKDIIIVKQREDNILNIDCNDSNIPLDNNNLIYKAWELLKPLKEGFKGLDVYIEKNIPVAGGLAGGSSNAAYFMKLLNSIWNLNLSKDKLQKIGIKIGADIPYFFEEGTVRAEGIGDVFTKLKDFKDIKTLVVNSGCKINTAYIYENIKISKESKIYKCINTMNSKNPYVKESYYNVMTDISGKICPEIYQIVELLYSYGAKVALMSGSGSTVFGLYDNDQDFELSYERLKGKYLYVYKTKTI